VFFAYAWCTVDIITCFRYAAISTTRCCSASLGAQCRKRPAICSDVRDVMTILPSVLPWQQLLYYWRSAEGGVADTALLCLHWPSSSPLPSNRHHQSSGDCLEGKRENYQVWSVQYYVQQLYTVNCTHIWTELTVLWIGFCLTGPISLCLDSFLCMHVFCVSPYIACSSIVAWWGGPGEIEAYP